MIMKKFITILAVTAAAILISSCDKYDDGRPSKDVRHEFIRMYPDAWGIEWEYDGFYWEVDFHTGARPNGVEHTAWYDKDANWIRTVTEVPLASVPQKIKDYLSASEYGSSQYEDYYVDLFETPAGRFYRFDIYIDGREVEVDVTEDGKVTLASYGY